MEVNDFEIFVIGVTFYLYHGILRATKYEYHMG